MSDRETSTAPLPPLAGIRIVAVEQYGAGPYGTLILAALGAEVIKIEIPGSGDVSRNVGPHHLSDTDSLFFQTFNLNKRSLSLDLKQQRGQEILHKLVNTADALFDNMRGNQPEKLGLTYDQLKAFNKHLVCVHISAYGREGSRQHWPGYDYLLQAECGFMSLTGEVDGPPTRFGLSMVDYTTGMMAATALTAGILGARSCGHGRDLDVSLFDVALHQLSYPAVWYLNAGTETKRAPRSAHPSLTPSQLYRTKDGWIFIMCQTENFWRLLCQLLERADLLDDTRFATAAVRLEHRAQLTEILDDCFSQDTTAAWLQRLTGQIPCAPVHDLATALQNPFVAERDNLQQITHPSDQSLTFLRAPIRTNDLPAAQPAPQLGADSDELLQQLGYSQQAIEDLRRDRII